MMNPLRNVCFGTLCSVIVIALLNGCGAKIDAISTAEKADKIVLFVAHT